MSGRFAVGDVVVLDGHRLTVETVLNAEWVVVHDPDHEGGPSRYDIPARFLPDAEPRESPEIAAASAALTEALAVLDRYEQEHGQLEDGWPCLGTSTDTLRNRLASLPTPAGRSDAEPREEPEPDWQPGDVVRDVNGGVYVRIVGDDRVWLDSVGARITDADGPVRPVIRLVPEGSEREQERAAVVAWLRACLTCGRAHHPVGALASWSDPADGHAYRQRAHNLAQLWERIERGEHLDGRDGEQGTLRREAEGEPEAIGRASGPAAVPAPVTYDDSEGDLERLARDAAALTPGQPVAHRDGRLGVYAGRGMGSIQGLDLIWQAHGSSAREYTVASDLRPVSLVEKPEREAAVERIANTIAGWMQVPGFHQLADRIFDRLFGPGEPS